MIYNLIIKIANLITVDKKSLIYRAFFILIVILPILLLAVFSFINLYTRSYDEIIIKKRALAYLSSTVIHEKLEGLKNFGISLAIRPRLIDEISKGNWNNAINVIGNIHNQFDFIDRVVLFDPDAIIKADMPNSPGAIGQSRKDKNWYKVFSNDFKPLITEVYQRGAEPKINVISIIIPIKTEPNLHINSFSLSEIKKNIIGILQIQIKLESFQNWIKQTYVSEGDLIYITDQLGHIVYHPKINSKENITDFSEVNIVQKMLKGFNGAEINYNPVEKEKRIAAYEPVPDYGWGVVVTQPVKYAFNDRNKKLFNLFLTYFIFLITALILAYFLLYTIIIIKKTSDKLKKSNDDLDDFAYIASHDLKEPLRSISNYSAFLLEDYKDKLDQEGTRMLKTLITQAGRLENLISSLLKYSRIGREKFTFEPTDLNEIILIIKEDLNALIKENNAEIIIEKSLPVINCDRVIIKEIFLNLISNAVKYNNKPEKKITIGFLENSDKNHYTFYVKDNGIGISEKHFDTIFKIFKRLNPREKYGGGSGAGLTIVKKMIESLNGKIWLESEPDKGSIFYFYLGENL